MKNRKDLAIIGAILLIGVLLRFTNIATNPGFEWDEPVYTAISDRTNIVGYPNLKGEENLYNDEPYLYHPPFDFYLKGAWYKLLGSTGIGEGRILSAIEGMISVIVAFFCLKELAGKKQL
jgi:4-amino-4-deoxy-L-arabinose transferase-like glycosyltransferase